MTLPGKLCVGIVEEDNPLKSYFRFKPLLIEENDEYRVFEEREDFPENGCIRIVPDKNESSRFKARMRKLNGYCIVDLRAHADDNDKIRPNKNYRGDDSESNAYIIYSDVVREPRAGMIAEIIAQEAPDEAEQIALSGCQPRSERVLLLSNGAPAPALWTPAPIADMPGGVSLARTGEIADLESAMRFDIQISDAQTLSFYIARRNSALWQDSAPAANCAAEDKPWICHDASVAPPPVDPRLAPREMARERQRGINPIRGRSIQEIIDDKWRHSRLDQLGHPVAGDMHCTPLTSPIEAALDALREAWTHDGAREGLVRAISEMSGLGEALCGGREALAARERDERYGEYDAQLKQLRDEIAALEGARDVKLSELKAQMLENMDSEVRAREERVRALDEQARLLRARADEAVDISEAAERALDEMTNITLERKLAEFAITSRASDLLKRLHRGAPARPIVTPLKKIDSIAVPELAERVRATFARAGFEISPDEAVNMLACLALGSHVLITGPTGCGKTACARLLSCALGLTAEGRMVAAVQPGATWYDGPSELDQPSELPLMAFCDDINARPDVYETLISLYENREGVKLIMTAQDSNTGHPIPSRVLDRSFTIRLKLDDSHVSWALLTDCDSAPNEVITLIALKSLFKCDSKNISPQVAARMSKLRADLSRYGVALSRRTIGELWRYCASVTPHLKRTPLETLDLAFSQRALPAVIASAGVDALHALPELLVGMPVSRALLTQPLAIEV